jgi:hypothetical protein
MTALLLRIFLSLSVLLSGSSALSAHPRDQGDCASREHSEHSGYIETQERPLLIVNPAESHQGIPFFKMLATEPRAEEDENEHDSVNKKRSGCGSYIIAIFGAETLHYFLSEGKKALPWHQYFSFTASYRYLVLQVFRI